MIITAKHQLEYLVMTGAIQDEAVRN